MKVKIKIPTSLDGITIGQYQKIYPLLENEDLTGDEIDNEILRIVTGIDNIEDVNEVDRKMLIDKVSKSLTIKGEFKTTFNLNGIEFGLIPNFDNISNGEYIDLIKYSESLGDLHRFMAVAYRPLKFKDRFKNYTIVNYEGTKYNAERMLEMPMTIAEGVRGFFLTLSNDLGNYIATFTATGRQKEMQV